MLDDRGGRLARRAAVAVHHDLGREGRLVRRLHAWERGALPIETLGIARAADLERGVDIYLAEAADACARAVAIASAIGRSVEHHRPTLRHQRDADIGKRAVEE